MPGWVGVASPDRPDRRNAAPITGLRHICAGSIKLAGRLGDATLPSLGEATLPVWPACWWQGQISEMPGWVGVGSPDVQNRRNAAWRKYLGRICAGSINLTGRLGDATLPCLGEATLPPTLPW